jgi:ABC-type oligopeptide transport system substrate-binding subunit
MKRVLRLVSMVMLASGGLILAGCGNTSADNGGHQMYGSSRSPNDYPVTQPADRQMNAATDNGTVGNGAFGQPPP